MKIQSVLISKKLYSLNKAIEFLDKHGLSHNKVDITNNYYRFRQIPPKDEYNYITEDFKKGVKLIIVV